MKKMLLFITLISSFLIAENPDYKIIDSAKNKEIEFIEMIEKLSSYDVIFFGEYHENTVLHKLEFDLLKKYFRLNPKLIVSLEMFERDVQPVLDNYLSNKITEDEFLKSSRPWPNYQSDYRPLVEFAKENKLSVVASNIPRRYASMISKQGLNALDSLTSAEKKYVAKKHKVFDDEYKERFIEIMKQNMAHMPENKESMKMDIEALYAAQCIKDDTMAESILLHQRILPRRKVIHFNGEFHSRKHLGTAQKLQIMEPMLKIAVISPVMCVGEFKWNDEDLKEGEFLILLMEKETEE